MALHNKAKIVLAVLAMTALSGLAQVRSAGNACGTDPCEAKARYEAAKLEAAKSGQGVQLQHEPNWDLIPAQSRAKVRLLLRDTNARGDLLKTLETDLALARNRKTFLVGALTLEQATRQLEIAKRANDDGWRTFDAKNKRTTELTGEIQRIVREAQELEKRKPRVRDLGYKERQAIISKREAIANCEDDLRSLLGTHLTQSDLLELARRRANDLSFKDFHSERIDEANELYGKAVTPNELDAARGVQSKALQDARQQTLKKIQSWETTKKSLQPYEEILEDLDQQIALNKEMQAKVAEKAKLAQQKPTEGEMAQLNQKLRRARSDLDAVQLVRDYEVAVREVRPWVQAQGKILEAQEAEAELREASEDYQTVVKQKNNLMDRVHAALREEQNRINRVQARHQGGSPEGAYFQQMSRELLQARATNQRLVMALSDYDCFPEVRHLMDYLHDRNRKLDQQKEQLIKLAANSKPVIKKPQAAVIAKKPVRRTPAATAAVEWVCDGPEIIEKHGQIEVNGNKAIYTRTFEGKSGEGSTSWGNIPRVLREGQTVELTISTSAVEPAHSVGWFIVNCAGKHMNEWDNWSASWPDGDKNTPSQGANIRFKFEPKSSYDPPFIQICAGDISDYSGVHSVSVIYKYHKK